MKPVSRIAGLICGVALCAAVGLSGTAFANGDEFFGAEEIPGEPVFVYFGTVKSDDGKYLEATEVTLKVSDPPMTFVVYTDILGRFRTLDAGRALSDLGYEVDPSTYDVTVAREGYVQTRRMNRAPANAKEGAYEINFIMSVDKNPKAKPKTAPLEFKSTPASPVAK